MLQFAKPPRPFITDEIPGTALSSGLIIGKAIPSRIEIWRMAVQTGQLSSRFGEGPSRSGHRKHTITAAFVVRRLVRGCYAKFISHKTSYIWTVSKYTGVGISYKH